MQYTTLYERLCHLRRELARLREEAEAGRKDEEWLRYQVEELAADVYKRQVLYPTPIGRSGALAWVEYTPDGHYTIVAADSLRQRTAWPMPGFSEVHGLAWDNATDRLYTLVTDDSGTVSYTHLPCSGA